ncbi:hypothetical protein RUND412_005149 [Rhizina undulata]
MSTHIGSVTANGPTEYSGTCGQASLSRHHSGPSSHQHGPDTPVLSSSLPFSITAKGPTEYSGTGDQASKFLDRSFVPVSTDVSATGSATSSEKASSSHETSSSSNSSTSASEADPSSMSIRFFASSAAASFGSGSSSADSTLSADQGPLNLSRLRLSARGAAWPRLQPFRRPAPAPTNGGQFGVYFTSIYANHSDHGVIFGDYEEAGPADVAIEKLRAIVNNVQTTPDAINGAPEEDEKDDQNDQELECQHHEDGAQEHSDFDGEREHFAGEREHLAGERENLGGAKEHVVQEGDEQEHPVQEDGEEEHPRQVHDINNQSEKVHGEKEISEQEPEEQEQYEQVEGAMEHSEQAEDEKELTEQELEQQNHPNQVGGEKELSEQELEGKNHLKKVDGGKELPEQEPEERQHQEQDCNEEYHDGDGASVRSLTSNQVNDHFRHAERPQTPLDFSGLALGKCISGTVREYEISHIQEFAPIDLGDVINKPLDLKDCTRTRPYAAGKLVDIDLPHHNYPNEKTHSRWHRFSNKFTNTERDRAMEQKYEEKSRTNILKKKAAEKIKTDSNKAEIIFGAAIRKVKKLARTRKALAVMGVKRP